MTIALPLGWTGSFDEDSSVLHLATGDARRAATLTFAPAPEDRGGGLLDRATGFLEAETHRLMTRSWQDSCGRLPVGGRAFLDSRAAGTGAIINGSTAGHRRRHRTGEITLEGRNYRVRHRSRWRSVVEVDDQRLAVLTRRPLSRRRLPLDRTSTPTVRTKAVSEADRLAVVLAASVMGPPGRPGFWGELARSAGP